MTKSELRQDPVSGEWILIAPKRGRRPHEFVEKRKLKKHSAKNCPFEDFRKSGNLPPVVTYTKGKNWVLEIIPNKYPAVSHGTERVVQKKKGPFETLSGTGYHDLVITRDHNKNLAALSSDEAVLLFNAFQERYLMFLRHPHLYYTAIFQNWGPKAGASVYHPHYQIISLPVVPPDIGRSLEGSKLYFQKHKTCVHCAIINWEKRQRKRIIFENDKAVAFTPFTSKSPFEIRIFPKKHLAFFEDTNQSDLRSIIQALQTALKKMNKSLKEPDYNFFIHTSPLKSKKNHLYYHWHIEIVPKLKTWAGFEFETGISINDVDPDEAAKLLRSAR